jgi:hypothetical protein
MGWLFASLAALTFAVWHYTIVQLTVTTGDWYYDYSIFIIPSVVCACLFIVAGVSFGSIDDRHVEPAQTPLPPSHPVVTKLTATQELDIVLYVANLVSNPTDIDIVLDDVRTITSRLQPGQAPSAEDLIILDKVYSRLEDYLLHQDALRVFTVEELRGRIKNHFGFKEPLKTTLWT